jgi:ribosomal protein S3AE
MAEDNRQAAKNAAKAAQDLKKAKKKKWFPLVAPESFQNRVIGEVLLEDASVLMHRTVKVNMMQLMGDMKKQNVNVMFKVNDVKDGKAYTEAVKFEVSAFSLKRLAKREKDKLSDSFVVKTLDGKLVRIKSVMITNAMTNGAVQASLVQTCRAICKEIINKLNFEQLIIDLVVYKFQKEVRESLHKVYPLRNFDIKMLALETKKKKETVEEEMLMKLKKEREKKLAEKAEEQEHKSAKHQHDEDADSEDSQDSEDSDSEDDATESTENSDEPLDNVPADEETSEDETDDEDSAEDKKEEE